MPRLLGPKPIVIPPPLPWQTVEPEPTLRQRLRAWPRSRWVIAGLSLATTIGIVTLFLIDSRSANNGRVVNVVFAQSWPETRGTAEIAADRDAEQARLATEFAASRAYIATLPPATQTEARAQYNAYAAALKPSQRPADYVAPPPPVAAAAE